MLYQGEQEGINTLQPLAERHIELVRKPVWGFARVHGFHFRYRCHRGVHLASPPQCQNFSTAVSGV